MSADAGSAAHWRERVVLLTGATGGLGRALAARLASLGSELVLLSRKQASLARMHDELEALCGRRPGLCPFDLERASPADYQALAETLEREFGRLHLLVHGAAHFPGLTPLEHTDPVEWLRGLHVNLSAPMLLTMACLPLLRRARGARVVFLLEEERCSGRPLYGAYGIAKGALADLASMLAGELEASGVDVLAVRLPPMRTALRARAWFAEDPSAVPDPASLVGELLERMADPRSRGTMPLRPAT